MLILFRVRLSKEKIRQSAALLTSPLKLGVAQTYFFTKPTVVPAFKLLVKIQDQNLKNLQRGMFLLIPINWFHSRFYQLWPVGLFEVAIQDGTFMNGCDF